MTKTENWTTLHKDFGKSWGESLKENWESNDFDYNQTKTWISIGLIPREHDLAWWIVNKQNQILEYLDSDKIKGLREKLKHDWKEISSEWDIETQTRITKWIKKGFTQQEVKQWKEIGLDLEESDLAVYSKQKGYDAININVEELRREYNEKDNVDAQEWLDKNYPKEKRDNIKKLNIGRKNLKDSLKLEKFTNLEELHCYDNQLSILDCLNCSQLKIVRCQKNNLTNLNLAGCPNLTELYCNRNQLADLGFLNDLNSEKLEVLLIANNNFSESNLEPFRKFPNLKNLGLGNWFKEVIEKNIYNRFFGSLKSLKNLTKLEDLDIAGTDVDSGIKHLTSTIQMFHCSNNERVGAKAEIIAEKLRKYGEREKDDDGDENFAHPLQVWREFLDSPAQQWLDEKYPLEERKDISYLDISKKNLKGTLKLKGFTKLRTLVCFNNQLTNLNLSDCQNLVILDCSNNELHDLYFLNFLSKLENLTIKNNSKLAPQNLKYLASLKDLMKLNISDCPLEGSLKILKELNKLESLKISNTNISEGLEYLPENCKKNYCDSDYPRKSVKIVKELEKSKCSEEDEGYNKYYNLDKWREDKANNLAISVIPTERLFVIRSNIKKFVNKWGVKEDDEDENDKKNDYITSSYDKISKLWKEDESNLSELSKLRHPNEFSKQWWLITSIQWINRAASVVGGSLVFVGQSDTTDPNSQLYTQTGGVVAIASPFVETITSYINDQVYEAKQAQWDEFVEDTKNLLDSYHELLGILEKIEMNDLGIVNKTLNNLRKRTESLLKEYDKDKENGMIDIGELTKRGPRRKFAKDLSREDKEKGGGSQLGDIIKAMKTLEDRITAYKQGKLDEKSSDEAENNQQIEDNEETVAQTETSASSSNWKQWILANLFGMKEKREIITDVKQDEETKKKEVVTESENDQENKEDHHYTIDLKENERGGLTEEFQTQIQIPPK